MNRQLFKNNGHSKFPMSTDALDFIQEQVFLAYQLSYLAGDNVIIRNSTSSQSGLCIYDGELLPLTGTPAKYIFINSVQQSVTANGETFDNVRTTRTAIYTDANMGKPVSAFATLIDLVTLKNQLTDLQTQRRKPKVCDAERRNGGDPNARARFLSQARSDEPTMCLMAISRVANSNPMAVKRKRNGKTNTMVVLHCRQPQNQATHTPVLPSVLTWIFQTSLTVLLYKQDTTTPSVLWAVKPSIPSPWQKCQSTTTPAVLCRKPTIM